MMDNSKRLQGFYRAMEDQPSHAWLITGGQALEAAHEGAARLLCQADEGKPCGRCKCCKMRAADSHPDLRMLLPPEDGKGRSIKVEEVRDLRDWLGQTPQYGRKVLVMADAQRMTEAAQNALLRSLEEPPEGCFFLLTGEEGGLLPTLRSRMNPLRLGGEGDSPYAPAMEQAQSLILLALRGDWTALASGYGKKKAEMRPLLGAQAELLRDMLAAGLGGPMLVEGRRQSLGALAQGKESAVVNRWLSLALEAQERLEANANPSMTADWLSVLMKRAVVGGR